MNLNLMNFDGCLYSYFVAYHLQFSYVGTFMLKTFNEERAHLHGWNWLGVGHCSGHFGEIVQGRFTAADGSTFRGLVTLFCRSVGTTVTAAITLGSGRDTVPLGRLKVQKAVDTYRHAHGLPADHDVTLQIKSSIPAGIGMGSSTADIVATFRAMDQAYGNQTDVEDLLAMVLRVEAACDSTMLDHRARLFAQRDGRVVEDFGCRLPPFYVLGFNLMPEEIFRTDETSPAEYTDAEIADFDDLLFQLRRSIQLGDCLGIAKIATRSAIINQRKFPKQHFDRLMSVCSSVGASGVCISHSGTVAGLIFPVNRLPPNATLAGVSTTVESWGGICLGLYRM